MHGLQSIKKKYKYCVKGAENRDT